MGDPESAGGCLAPVRGCVRIQICMDPNNYSLDVCLHCSSVKGKIKVGLSGNRKIENKKPGVP